jgi:hypothetical protein
MDTTIWILLGIAVSVVVLGIIALIIKSKKHAPTDYYALFVIGIVWIPVGIALKNYALSSMGIIFAAAGLAHKDSWKNNRRSWRLLSNEEKMLKGVLILITLILLAGGLVYYLIVTKGSM